VTPLAASDLHGVWSTALLPLRDDDTIDLPRLADDLDYLVAARPHGIYVHGSAGEFQTLSVEEYQQINTMVATRCADTDTPFQIGASHPSGQESLDRIRIARQYAPGAIQVILPDWLPLSPADVARAVRAFAAAADPIPLVLYNPPHAKTIITPDDYGQLATTIPSLIGIKVAGGDPSWHRRMRESVPQLAVFVAGHRLGRELPLGAKGSYSNIACLSPRGARTWYDQTVRRAQSAQNLQRRVDEFFALQLTPLRRAGYSAPALDKFLAAIGGWAMCGLRIRWPHSGVPDEAVPSARERAEQLIPELLLG
jgi:dihydrodipicolinate synthase/N-acetylneuraminate lyase